MTYYEDEVNQYFVDIHSDARIKTVISTGLVLAKSRHVLIYARCWYRIMLKMVQSLKRMR